MDIIFASKATGTVVDFVLNGKTALYGKSLEEVRRDYPDAEEMTLDEWRAWKFPTQRPPITWEETTEERHDEMLGAVPPAAWHRGGFLVGEPWDHDALTGQPRYQAFRQSRGRFEVASRPMTVAEFKAL